MMIKYIVCMISLVMVIASCSESSVNDNNIEDPIDTPVAGIYQLGAQGGDSVLDNGGQSGSIRIWKQGGTGNVEILRTGKVDANFGMPNYTVDLGSNPYELTSNTELLVQQDDPGVGILYVKGINLTLNAGDPFPELAELYVGGNPAPITGLHILPGVRLSIPLNYTVIKRNPRQEVQKATLFLVADLHNEGTIVVVNDGTGSSPYDLSIKANRYLSSAAAIISNSAANENQWGGNIELTSQGDIINQGDILANNGTSRFLGGDILMQSPGIIFNTGAVSSDGGNNGGVGQVSFFGDLGIRNSGNVKGGINFTTNPGSIVNSGNLVSQGSADALEILLRAQGGDIINSGDLIARGQNGGLGADITILATPKSTPVATGNILLSGNIDSSGGATNQVDTIGGSAGDINIIANVSGSGFFAQFFPVAARSHENIPTSNQTIQLLGYGQINNSGGDGIQGGSSGLIQIQDEGEVWQNAGFVDAQGGNILVQAHIYSNGGHSSEIGRQGGVAGDVLLQSDIDLTFLGSESIQIQGDINLIGGNSFSVLQNFEHNTKLEVFASGQIVLQGLVDILASPDIGIRGYGANLAQQSRIQSTADTISIKNTMSLAGGNGAFSGGSASAGLQMLAANGITISSGIGIFGGSADPMITNSIGGDGGSLQFGSATVTISCVYQIGDLDVSGGLGQTNGQSGTITPLNCQ